jgi:hypothetical protein
MSNKQTTEENVSLIKDATKKAILSYAKMAQTSDIPPEGFIRDFCAIHLHQSKGWCVRIELSARDCESWGIDRTNLLVLSKNFLIDLACFNAAWRRGPQHLQMLVEFKLWTSRNQVVKDIRRLKEIIGILREVDQSDQHPVNGYVVCLPHYSTAKEVVDAVTELKSRIPSAGVYFDGAFQTDELIEGPSAAIVVIDVNSPDLSTILSDAKNIVADRELSAPRR